jgi:CRISPR-associated protein Cas1
MYVIEVSQEKACVRIQDGCLAISADGRSLGKVPVQEVGVVLLSSPHTMCSVTALASLASQGTPVVFCDAQVRPAGMILPFRGQHDVGRRISSQAVAAVPTRKRLWKSIVQSKIAGQAAILREITGSDHHLSLMIKRVRSGDPTNIEARAARRYWRRLLGQSFRRRRGVGIANKMLDYGYAVLRASVTRALCVAGLHPSLGIHHHHRANAFALADDVMEPFRPVVDRVVAQCMSEGQGAPDLSSSLKRRLAGSLKEQVPWGCEARTVEDAAGKCASSLAGVFLGQQKEVSLPWIG